ncbi:enoyl-CoA hydratase/isomerase family protein [Natrinema amylolyticum]|uniref:enoyl-CoA hydratase/isomerase family protein n=1 Tax=Natrinema amylolyticum TaxID=2878679 RepID=UPI001CFC3FA1|nr:enoyl-CoA hydratase/isomerase family protein [Natrinema amylolyticum]
MSDVEYECEDGYALITLDRPAVYNAFHREMILELNETLRRARDDDEAYAVVLTGAGDGFCSGADVESMPDWSSLSKEEYGAYLWSVQNVVRQLRSMRKPTVAAVNGPAIGAGCDFALACDIRYVGEDAVLREGFVRIGLVPGDGGAWLLPRLIGEAKAREYLLTGKDITPDAAEELGLAAGVSSNPLASAREFAETVRDLPATAVQQTKQLVDPQQDFETHCERAIEYQWNCVNDEEHVEAVRAFSDGREPEYDREYTS